MKSLCSKLRHFAAFASLLARITSPKLSHMTKVTVYPVFFRLQDKFGCVYVLDSVRPFVPSLYFFVGDHHYKELNEVRFLLKNIVCATLVCQFKFF